MSEKKKFYPVEIPLLKREIELLADTSLLSNEWEIVKEQKKYRVENC